MADEAAESSMVCASVRQPTLEWRLKPRRKNKIRVDAVDARKNSDDTYTRGFCLQSAADGRVFRAERIPSAKEQMQGGLTWRVRLRSLAPGDQGVAEVCSRGGVRLVGNVLAAPTRNVR